MPFVKMQKDKAYFKRFQVKYRRRREGKTDYFARKKLIVQAKNKYNTPKYRLVVRFTNKFVICQIVMSEITGDRTVAAANSKELTRYGVKAGFKNYAAAYATGLLVGRRLLTSDKMTVKTGEGMKTLGELYKGNTVDDEEVGGEIVETEKDGRTFFVEDVHQDAKPFRCFLDVGLRPTTLGCRVWGALKGAVDAGLDIPHSPKKFPGYDTEENEYDPAEHREKIVGEHVAEFMRNLNDPDWCEEKDFRHPDDYQQQFGEYIKQGLDGDAVPEMYLAAHAAIREDPTPAHAESAKARVGDHAGRADAKAKGATKKGIKHTFEERMINLEAKKEALAAAKAAEESSSEEDESESDE